MSEEELPEGWAIAPLSDFAEIVGGITKGQKRRPDEQVMSVPYLRVANVQMGYLDLREIKQIEATEAEIAALRLQPGDVLFTEGGDRDKLGRGWVWSEEIASCIHQNHIFRARPRLSEIQSKLISWFGNTYGRDYFMSEASQTVNLASINMTKLRSFPVRLPPAAEQARIVDAVDRLLAQTNAAKARLARVPRIVHQFRRAVLDGACMGLLTGDWREVHTAVRPARFLVELQLARMRVALQEHRKATSLPSSHVDVNNALPHLPDNWCWARLGVMGREPLMPVQTGPFGALLHREEFVETGVPVIAVGNLTGLGFTREGLYYITPAKSEELARFDVQAGDLLFARSGATLGKVCVAPDYVRDWRMTGHILRARLQDDVIVPQFAAYALRGCVAVVEQVQNSIRGVTRPGYNTSLLEGLQIPLPPLEEQREIVRRVKALFALADTIERRVAAATARADKVPQAILKKAFSGQLVPTEAELARAEGRPYESAAELLRRVRAEQPAAPKKPRAPRRRSPA